MSSTSDPIGRPSRLTQILVVRHAEVYNPADILYGRLPGYGLSERGLDQARATGRFLSSKNISAIYSSPLLRARQTAYILSNYHPAAPLHFTQDLLEVQTGYQGSPNSILKPGFSFFEPLHTEGDETMEDVWLRMKHFLSEAVRRHEGQTVVAVSHADPITVMRVGMAGQAMTAGNLHAAVYPARASVNQITLFPDEPAALGYFDVNNEGRP